MKNWSSIVKWDSFHSVPDGFGRSCSLHNAWWLLEPSLDSFRSNYFPVRHKITEWDLLESRWVISLLVYLLGRPVVQPITSGSEKPWATHCWVWAAPGAAVGASAFSAWLTELSPPVYLPNLICWYRKSHVQCEKEFLKKMKRYLEKAGSSPFVPILCLQSLLTQAFKNQWTELQTIPGRGHAVHEVTKCLAWLSDETTTHGQQQHPSSLAVHDFPTLSFLTWWPFVPFAGFVLWFWLFHWLVIRILLWYTALGNLALFPVSLFVLHCLMVLDRELFTPTLKSYSWVPGIFYLKLKVTHPHVIEHHREKWHEQGLYHFIAGHYLTLHLTSEITGPLLGVRLSKEQVQFTLIHRKEVLIQGQRQRLWVVVGREMRGILSDCFYFFSEMGSYHRLGKRKMEEVWKLEEREGMKGSSWRAGEWKVAWLLDARRVTLRSVHTNWKWDQSVCFREFCFCFRQVHLLDAGAE